METTRLASALEDRYRIERELGAGGMATVYVAEDLRHDRKVAIKVLKPELAAVLGADRFVQEIKTTAALSHPHILPLFDSGEADGFLYYVMPWIEGETIREKLNRETQFGIDEAIRIATEVADALDYAHQHGVIHRDIKPENILLHAGRPMVMDFGIALAVSAAAGGRMTETGLSLGTPHYMSPEQATADKTITARSDVYSLASVLYEMLAGEPTHTGGSAQQIIMKIIAEPAQPVTDLRKSVPFNVAAALGKALEKLPADRFDSARGFAEALANPTFATATAGPSVGATARAHSRAKALIAGLGATVLLTTGIALWALFRERPAAPPPPPVRMTLSDFVVENVPRGGWRIAISRDGSTIVAGGAGGMLYQRRSDDTEFRPIPGTEGARNPSISPDGTWLVFQQGGALYKVQLGGGPVLPVTEEGGSPHWFSAEEIVYDTRDGTRIVSAAGGPPRKLTEDGGSPFMLPGRRGLILNVFETLVLHDLETGKRTTIAQVGSNGRYVPTGHILYGDRTLQSVMAVPFDLEAMEVTGDPVTVLPSVNIFSGGAVQLAVSDNGTLVHGLAVGGGGARRFSWIDMAGRRTDLALDAPNASTPRLSPDGNRFVFEDGTNQLRVYNVLTGEATQVADSAERYHSAAWSRDGTALFHSVGRPRTRRRWIRTAADGSGVSEELVPSAPGPITSLSPDGRWLVGEGDDVTETRPDIVFARLDSGEIRVQTYLRAEWREEEGVVSPDGRWMAYVSNEGGGDAVYIRSFPAPGPATRVSAGNFPVWSPEGDALYFQRVDRMIRRSVRLGDAIELGQESDLFGVEDSFFASRARMYDLHPDGDRFLFVMTDVEEAPADMAEAPAAPNQGIGPVVVVVNWFTELRERMGEATARGRR
jgi:Tol biopolymer transport system component